MRFAGLAAVAVSFFMCAAAPSSQAATFSLTQTQAPLGPGPYGTLTVNQAGANLNFSLVVSPFLLVDTGAHYAFAFNLSGGGAITNLASGFAVAAGSSFNNAPYGPFNYAISCTQTGGTGCSNQSLTFTVANALLGGLTNFSADVKNTGTGETGVAFGTTVQAVPGPIAGAGVPALAALCGIWLMRRRRSVDRVA